MTIDDFFEKLPKDGWQLQSNCWIRRHESPIKCECPVSSLAGLSDHQWRTAAALLGLTRTDASDLVDAADRFESSRYPLYGKPLRARLLAHCGLTEAS